MTNKVEILDIKIDLADSEIPSYFCVRKENKLIIKIESWDAKIIEFIFYDFLGFIYRGGDGNKDFCINHNQTCFFNQMIEKKYGKIPDNHPYKLYQLLDFDDNPYFEVISPYYEVSKKSKINN
jgi:hypothetical protein